MKRCLIIAILIPLFIGCKSSGNLTQGSSDLASEDAGPPYLALGDSIAFGHNPLVPMTNESVQKGVFRGYPEVIAQARGLALTNASCIGETSGSFMDATQADNGCRSGDKAFHPYLKIKYEEAQLDFAKTFLKQHPDTKLVTLNIGGNDLLLMQWECKKSFSPISCKSLKLPGTALGIGNNLSKIIVALRADGYQGQIIVMTQYATDYNNTLQWVALGSVKKEIEIVAKMRGVTLAPGYDVFKKAAESFEGNVCKAGLLLAKADGTCDDHPSEKGRELLAKTVMDLISP